MPRIRQQIVCAWAALSGLAVLAGCPKPAPEPAEAPPVAAAPAPAAVPEDGPPPERYATLPPGAVDASGATPAGTTGDPAAPAQPADPGLLPGAGNYNLTGVRLGMTAAEVYGRYPADSGWDYDSKFVGDTGTGVIMAKPRDERARASELFYLEAGAVVAFLRAVQEDADAYHAAAEGLIQQYGAGEEAPPQWARSSGLLRSWRSTPNETAHFWSDPRKRVVLTAGHSPAGTETVYMLFDVDRVEPVQQALAQSGAPAPVEPDRSWNPPPAGAAPTATSEGQ